MITRCPWPGTDPLYVAYHDLEWGVVERDDRALYEKLVLDGFQAGLSWICILRKREAFRRVFDGFQPESIARWDDARIAAALSDPGIVRNRAKVQAAVTSARAWLELRDKRGSFADFVWQFTDGRTIRNAWTSIDQLPAETEESRALSKALKLAGFRFCGPTIVYAFMQAIGMVNDHVTSCFRWAELG
jgi:DNA-3-methyladenine glycosylase I